LDGYYKTLHIIAPTKLVFQTWETTLRKQFAIRQTLMSGMGNFEMRQAIWEKQYWKGADEDSDHKLEFDEIEKMCRRLNIHSSTESLLALFKVIFIFFFFRVLSNPPSNHSC
jgi:phosphatidylinositol phospholipase C delta